MNGVTDISFPAVDRVAEAARAAASTWSLSSASTRARLLEGLAVALEEQAASLVDLADAETGLGSGRLNGELARTAFQLRGFATEVKNGVPFRTVDDPAVPGAPPAGRPRLTREQVPLGPVAMFSASNFPFAFSVLGGDTASALAAGCPVIVKAHSGHAELSRRVFALASRVVGQQGLPAGLLTFLDNTTREANTYLVQHSEVAAVAFTGSWQGGVALWRAANDRSRPVPFYGELGSINPLVVLPAALASGVEQPAQTLAASIALGCGQFCTSPGVVCVFDDADGDRFVAAFAEALGKQTPHRMLTDGIWSAYRSGVERLEAHRQTTALIRGQADAQHPAPRLFEVAADAFIGDPELREEVFGPAALVVRVQSVAQAIDVLKAVHGSLTVTVWGADEDTAENRALVHAAEQIAGRVLFGGVPTGVAVTHAQQHGGPWPASTAPQTTSVGYAAIERFLRPVALQDAPSWLLAVKKEVASS
ncbi:aldehyde dehydrogenase (NADP(+)) [Burkholderia multivorans]|uniref:aldehyde dehydrogenase (NADP(+)) n=1 Tax=Burkholderia multivorans TaxID=87883 RepID=UPI001C235068|nr:aldehyde dehydrogenase (NADP(+)) [Burkholderia multivorans]MBU9363461.1 aldehyde dehydrogenase (NADP(+)) [Burkholderia multivorans]